MLKLIFIPAILFLSTVFLSNCKTAKLERELVYPILPTPINDSFIFVMKAPHGNIWIKDYKIYELPHLYSTEEDGVVLTDTFKFEYFVVKKGDSTGYFFDSINQKKPKEIAINEIIETRAIRPLIKDTLFKYLKGPPVITKEASGIKYHYAYIQDGYDSLIITVNNQLNSTKWSFSPELDSMLQGKVSKLIILKSKQLPPHADYKNKFRELVLELKKEEVKNQKEILNLIEIVKAEQKN